MSAVTLEQRNARKVVLQRELTLILIDELLERSLEKDSWYQMNIIKLSDDYERFWAGLGRYVCDCIQRPPEMTRVDLIQTVGLKVKLLKASFPVGG